MTTEDIEQNQESWTKIERSIDGSTHPGKVVALRLIRNGLDHGFGDYFRVCQSMFSLVFTTVGQPWYPNGPSVRLAVDPSGLVNVTYNPASPAASGDNALGYQLEFEEAFATFHRFLLHLWTISMPEPVPAALRNMESTFTAPILDPGAAGPGPWPSSWRQARKSQQT